MNILSINCGSSSLKWSIHDVGTGGSRTLFSGFYDGIGQAEVTLHTKSFASSGKVTESSESVSFTDHRAALAHMGEMLQTHSDLSLLQISAIGHRVVHGGTKFVQPTLIDNDVLIEIKSLSSLAPLHNPLNVLGIEECQQLFPGVPQYAVFDTAFHATMPSHAYRYAVPNEWYEQYDVRRYGFHGIAHESLVQRAAQFLGKPALEVNLITLHLGSGASAAAIAGGQSIDTSMGFTPLSGLMMASRCGDIDPSIPLHLIQNHNLSAQAVEQVLNHESGLQGIVGTSDMREVLEKRESGDANASLAVAMYVTSIRKYIGAYIAAIGPVDAIVFSGGAGENSPILREEICAGLAHLGIALDTAENDRAVGGDPSTVVDIAHSSSLMRTLVIPADEENEIARQVFRLTHTA